MAYYDVHNLEHFFSPDQLLTKKFETGDILFHGGDKARLIYFVLSGEIRAETYLEDGQSVVFYRARAGNTLCEENLGLTEYQYSGVASEPSRVRAISKFDLLEKMRTSWEFTHQLTTCLADRYSDAIMLRELIGIRSAEQRLWTWLHWQEVRGLVPLDLRGRLGTIAPELGLSRESVYRAVSRLEKKGKIKRGKRLITHRLTIREGFKRIIYFFNI